MDCCCSPTEQALPKGTVLEEFVIERVLGGGGFGVTYVAQDTRLDRWVVVKENLPAFYASREPGTLTVRPRSGDTKNAKYFEESLEFFSREAKILASLNHPGIVPVLRSFEAFGTAFFVMPYVEGVAFADLIDERQRNGEPFSEAEAAGFLENILAALGYLHGSGIFHRDIKPPNILVTREGKPVLIDFGAAWHNHSTETANLIESAGYTAYEQIMDNGRVGAWTDLYGLGAMIYRAITFTRPVSARDRAVQDTQVPLANRADLTQWYSSAFLRTVDRAMAVEIKNRWRTAGDWNTALSVIVRTSLAAPVGLVDERIQSQVGGDAMPAASAEQATSPTTVPTGPVTAWSPAGAVPAVETPVNAGASPKRGKPSMKAAIIVGAVAGVLLIVGLVAWAIPTGSGDSSATQTVQAERKSKSQLASERAAEIARDLEEQAKAAKSSESARPGTASKQPHQNPDQFAKKQKGKAKRGALGTPPAQKNPTRGSRPGEVREFQIASGMKVPFCWIPAGSFRMGSPTEEPGRGADESPVREVKISRGFWMAQHETTQAEWETVTGANPSRFKGGRLPVEQVSWLDVCGDEQRSGGFLGKVQKHAPVNWRFDLPTEAQWESACRAGVKGSDAAKLDSLAWHKGNSGRKTREIGKKSPNSWGLLDVCGNVAEWCRDWYQPSYGGLSGTDPEGPGVGAQRVLRGGCWASKSMGCRPASRGKLAPGKRSAYVGFRLCLVPKDCRQLLLSEMNLKGVEIGWGVPGINVSVESRTPLSIGGRKFSKGLGLHAPSVLSFGLDGKAKEFRAWVGVDDDAPTMMGSVEFQIWADGRKVWMSGVMRRGNKPMEVWVPLAGVRKLALLITPSNDGTGGDHGDWAEATIEFYDKAPRLVVSESKPNFDPAKHLKQSAANFSPDALPKGIPPGEERAAEVVPGVKMKFCRVPPGDFTVGSSKSERDRGANEGPPH